MMAILHRPKRKIGLVRCDGCGHERELAEKRCSKCGAKKTVPLHL